MHSQRRAANERYGHTVVGMSAFGPWRASMMYGRMSAFGGGSGHRSNLAECPLMTQSRPQDRCQERINVKNKSMNTRPVTMAAPVRKVMYRKTLNIETWSESTISQ